MIDIIREKCTNWFTVEYDAQKEELEKITDAPPDCSIHVIQNICDKCLCFHFFTSWPYYYILTYSSNQEKAFGTTVNANYKLYIYGPYSQQVADSLHEGVMDDIFSETKGLISKGTEFDKYFHNLNSKRNEA